MDSIDLVKDLEINVDCFSWECPYCKRITTIDKHNIHFSDNFLPELNVEEDTGFNVQTKNIICPNHQCKNISIYVSVFKAKRIYRNGYHQITNEQFIFGKMFFPDKDIKQYPDYIPEPIRKDYEEACKISSLSPKASATLARRCIQGILRDFWKVKPDNLIKEIEQIKNKVDTQTYEAIDSVRRIGNIGAHMEKDINVIIDVDENEAEILISLLDILFQNWYIEKHNKEEQLKRIKEIADAKNQQKHQ